MGDRPISNNHPTWPRIQYFSNTEPGLGANSNNNRRAIIENLPAVAAKRTGMAKPTELKATYLSDSSIKLTWTDNSTTNIGYRIYKDEVLEGQVYGNISHYVVNGLILDKVYSFRVEAFNEYQIVSSSVIYYVKWSPVKSVEIEHIGTGLADHAVPGEMKKYAVKVTGGNPESIQWSYRFSSYNNGKWTTGNWQNGGTNDYFSKIFNYSSTYGSIEIQCKVTFASNEVKTDSHFIEWDNFNQRE